MYDLIIKNGTIINGSNKEPAFSSDIGVRNNKIVIIDKLRYSKAKKYIDAKDKVVAPGFIDIQNHSDAYGALFKNPSLESMLRQGITSIVVGQCGSSLSPLLKGSLSSIQKWSDVSGINVDWLGTEEFLDKIIRRRGVGVNFATLIGYGTLRRDLVEDESRSLNSKELSQIKTLYKRSLREGGWGLSLGLEYSHGRHIDEKEILELLTLTAKEDGLASFHLRSEEQEITSAIDEVVFLANKSKVRSKISHLKIKTKQDPDFAKNILKALEKNDKDNKVYFDLYPYTTSYMILYLLLPSWATEGGRKELLEKLQNKSLREEIKKDLKDKEYLYENIRIAKTSIDRTVVGKTIEEIAQNQNTTGEEVIMNLILASDDQTIVFFDNIYEPVMEELMKHPQAIIATNGSGWREEDSREKNLVHPRSFGTTARVLSRYVRDKKILTLEEAVYKMSGLPAKVSGIKNRGVIKKGNFADLVIFDPQTVEDKATLLNPFLYPEGISEVVINGHLVIEKEDYNKELAGVALTR